MIVDCGVYCDGRRLPGAGLDGLGQVATRSGTYAWVGLRMPPEAEVAEVGARLGWDDVAYDELVSPHARPVLTIDGDQVQLVLRTAAYLKTQRRVQLGELSVVANRSGVVSLRFGHATPLGGLRQRLEQDPERLALGPGAVLAAIVAEVVDGYPPVVDGFEADALEVEREVFADRPRQPVKHLYQLKRDVRALVLAIGALQDPLARLVRWASSREPEEVVGDLQEAREQLDRIVRRAESLSNLLDAALDAMLAQISLQQNDDMRKISAWVAVAAGPTLIAGIYGMNFETQPELRWHLGYPFALTLMLVLALALLRSFRRSGWL
ncbi:MAG: magnesium and cobalt transport protein CorA [Acidimicrobiales bacterium]